MRAPKHLLVTFISVSSARGSSSHNTTLIQYQSSLWLLYFNKLLLLQHCWHDTMQSMITHKQVNKKYKHIHHESLLHRSQQCVEAEELDPALNTSTQQPYQGTMCKHAHRLPLPAMLHGIAAQLTLTLMCYLGVTSVYITH